jgi:peptidyl-tRNA hydrolase
MEDVPEAPPEEAPSGRPAGAPDAAAADDPFRLYLVVRKGAVTTLARAGELAGAATVGCLRRFADDPAVADWRPRPGKVCLRARSPAQWEQVLAEPHVCAGDAVVAIPPRRRSERGPALERLQAMATELEPAPSAAPGSGVTYVLNPNAPMSSGKTLAQIGHAAVMAAEALPDWADAGCSAAVAAPSSPIDFAALAASPSCVARVEDAGLTEVPPGTLTVVAIASG